MATQTQAQRNAAAKKAAATRKRNEAKRSSASARTTAKRTATAATRRAEAQATRLEAVGAQFRRVAYVPVGAVLTARDNLAKTVRKYSDPERAQRELRATRHRVQDTLPVS